jgi:hypothetical protein
MCLVHNVKKVVKAVLAGTINLLGKHSRLTGMAMLAFREERLTLVSA